MIKRTRKDDLTCFLRALWWRADYGADKAATELLNRIFDLEEEVEALKKQIEMSNKINEFVEWKNRL